MEEFRQIRENLLDMLEDIDERLGKITDNGAFMNESEVKEIEEQSATEDSNQPNISVEQSMRNDMKNIQQAISQIDNGTYGICLSCGQPIKKEHLIKAQFFSRCIHCAEDKNGS